MKKNPPFLHKKAISFLVLVAFMYLFVLALLKGGKWLVVEYEPTNKVPAIILMGSIPDRALAAVDLYHQGRVKDFYIVEENMQGLMALRDRGFKVAANSEQMQSILMQAGIPDSLISIIPGLARSTLMEAKAYNQWLSAKPQKQPDTLLLISSAAHVRRASMIFNHILNRESERKIYVATYPSPFSDYNAEHWFKSKEDIQITLSEYIKIFSFLLIERWK